MLYYAVVYLKDGTIHLCPEKSEEKAKEILEKIKEKYNDRIDKLKIVKKRHRKYLV